MRRILVLAVSTSLLAAAPAAAGIKQRIAAANAVERKLERTHSSFRWVASCRQLSRTRFTCTFAGTRGSRGGSGTARVRKAGRRHVVTLGTITFS